MKSKYTEKEIEQMRQEILPLVVKYRKACKARKAGKSEKDWEWLKSEEFNKLVGLSYIVQDYYVQHKIWDSFEEYDKAIREVDPFGMFWHRESIRARLVRIKQPA